MNRGNWQATFHGVTRVRHSLATKPQGIKIPLAMGVGTTEPMSQN